MTSTSEVSVESGVDTPAKPSTLAEYPNAPARNLMLTLVENPKAPPPPLELACGLGLHFLLGVRSSYLDDRFELRRGFI